MYCLVIQLTAMPASRGDVGTDNARAAICAATASTTAPTKPTNSGVQKVRYFFFRIFPGYRIFPYFLSNGLRIFFDYAFFPMRNLGRQQNIFLKKNIFKAFKSHLVPLPLLPPAWKKCS